MNTLPEEDRLEKHPPLKHGGRIVGLALSLLPIASLAFMLVAWLRHGLDLPYRDDWREYLSGQVASLDISHLFRADNDTLSPVTRVLDAFAQRYLDGNAIAYQSLSMLLVLGSLLWLQWKLLGRVVGDRFLTACAFSSTLLMLQPGSYWGLQNLAYIQALPLVFILASLYVATQPEWSAARKVGANFFLGLLSGLSYISGAFATLAMSIVLLAVCVVRPSLRNSIAAPAIGSLVSGTITTAMQSWVILVVQHGKTHRADAPWALPVHEDFWFYLFGKVGRSLMLPASWGAASLVLAILAIIALVSLSINLLRKREHQGQGALVGGTVTISLLTAVGVYLFLIAAGRANLRPASVDGNLEIFRFAYHRFHFFWVTMLWPWLMAVTMIASGAAARRSRVIPGLVAVSVVLFTLWQGGFSHSKAFAKITAARLSSDAACLRKELAHGGRIVCPTLAPYGDLSRAYVYAIRTDASFVRYFPPEIAGSDLDSGPPFHTVLNHASSFSVRNAVPEESSPGLLRLSGSRDPMIIFIAGAPEAFEKCVVLQVVATIKAAYSDRAQLFYRTSHDAKFSEANSLKTPVGGGSKVVSFVAVSPSGFSGQLRLDPVANYQPSEVRDLSTRCLF